jgi:hypothetical protein
VSFNQLHLEQTDAMNVQDYSVLYHELICFFTKCYNLFTPVFISHFQGRDTRYLGKLNKDPYLRQHFTGSEYLGHEGETGNPFNFRTMYRTSYFGDQNTQLPTLRRFPKTHSEGTEGTIKLETATTDWFKEPDVPHKTPLQVLATSQEPHLKHNKWKYSNHGLPCIYPPYNVLYKEPDVNVF